MAILRKIAAGLKALFRQEAAENELDEEVTGFFEETVASKVRAGATQEQARREARLEMGAIDSVKHEVRSVGWEFAVETLFRDVHYGLRMIRKSPAFASLSILAIAIGIGANTAIFSLVYGVLLSPLPYPDANRLVAVGLHERGESGVHPLGVADFLAWRDQQRSFEHVAVFSAGSSNFALSGLGTPETIQGASVSADFFTTLGVSPLLGRGFLPGEDRPQSQPVAVVSENFWREHLSSDPNVLNRTITLDGKPFSIVGVMPAQFRFPASTPLDVWAIRTFSPPQGRPPYGLRAFGRLKPGVSQQTAQAELDASAARVTQQYPTSPELVSTIVPLKQWMVRRVSTALLILLGAISLVLLIAVVNVANLLLARASVRRTEIALRLALGASRARVICQLLTESVLLSSIGGIVGLMLAFGSLKAFLAFGPGNMPRLEDVGINGAVLLFTFAVCVGSGIVFGLAPALEASRGSVNHPLRAAKGSSASYAARRTHNILIVSEVGLALLLMIGSGLLIRSFLRLRDVDPGFRSDHLLTAVISLPRSYSTEPQIRGFWKEFLARVESMPGVSAAGISMSLPPNRLAITNPFTVEGQGYDRSRKLQLAEEMAVSPDYFRAMGIPLVRGRWFSESDKVEDAKDPMIVVINETMAKQYFNGQDPVGKRLQTGDPNPQAPWETVIGVVGDVKYQGLDAAPQPTLYVPYKENGWTSWTWEMYLVVRTPLQPESIVPGLRAQLASINKDLPISRVQTMDQLIEDSVVQERFRTWLVSGFAGLALLLAVIGIYAVISYSVAQQTREIGVRIALGATAGDVSKMVLGHGLRLAIAGIAIGLVSALGLTRILRSVLYSTSSTDLLSFVLTSALLLAVALLACYIPALRAARVDPIVALRYE